MFLKFWYNVFITSFKGTHLTANGPDMFINQSMGGSLIYFDYYTLRISLVCAISQLVAMFASFGRMSIVQLSIFTLCYNIGWSMTLFLLINMNHRSSDPRFFDDSQIGLVYLFGSCFGLFSSIFLKKPPVD